jgi:hypothetical protein
MQSILIAALLTLSSVLALQTGAPICTIDEAAPGPPHRVAYSSGNFTLEPRTGPLSDGTYIVTLNGATLVPNSTTAINASQSYTIAVTSEDGNQQYKGVLVIASSASTNFTAAVLQPVGGLLQASTPCAVLRRAGVTHTSAASKTTSTTTLNVPKNVTDLKLDVNVVVANNAAQGSIYYYDQYKFNVTGAPPPPTAAPVKPRGKCGLFGLSIFCPFTLCGFLGRLIFGSKNC